MDQIEIQLIVIVIKTGIVTYKLSQILSIMFIIVVPEKVDFPGF